MTPTRPVSGAHLNPAVTLVMRARGATGGREAALYVAAQVAGGVAGTIAAHLMFEMPPLGLSATVRTGAAQWWAEVVTTFGLVGAIPGGLRFAPQAIPWPVGLYITAAYWFTASTSFANPAVAVARLHRQLLRHPALGRARLRDGAVPGRPAGRGAVRLAPEPRRAAAHPRRAARRGAAVPARAALDRPRPDLTAGPPAIRPGDRPRIEADSRAPRYSASGETWRAM